MKTIQGYENYSVAEDGRVFNNKTGRELKYTYINTGYRRVGICRNNKQIKHLVHRLVAEAYVPNPDNKPCVNHLDKNKLNNHASNLEWCTSQENHRHSWANGRKSKKISPETIAKREATKKANREAKLLTNNV
jgi:hypothetical protein